MAVQDLCTLADVKTVMEASATGRDTLLSALITPASDAIMKEVEREFKTTVSNPATRTFVWASPGSYVDLSPYDLQSATAIALSPEGSNQALTIGNSGSGVTVEAPDVLLLPITAPEGVFTQLQLSDLLTVRVSNLLFRFGFLDITVTGTWGFPSVPTQVKQACAITVASWASKAVAEFGIEDYGHGGDTMLPTPASYYALPPAALKLIAPFRRYAGLL